MLPQRKITGILPQKFFVDSTQSIEQDWYPIWREETLPYHHLCVAERSGNMNSILWKITGILSQKYFDSI